MFIEHCGHRFTMLTGGFIAAIGLLIGSLANSIDVIFISFGFLLGKKFERTITEKRYQNGAFGDPFGKIVPFFVFA